MYIDVLITPAENTDFKNKTVIIIDVLRASTTILTALQNGANSVHLVVSVEDALKAKSRNPKFILGGERGGLRQTGFDLGNSPLEYIPEKVKDQDLVLTTTNGTLAANKAFTADNILIGCFRNLQAIVDHISKVQNDVIFFCAGNDGRFSIDDTICAAIIVKKISILITDVQLSESAKFILETDIIRFGMHENMEGAITSIMQNSYHGQRLIKLGFEQDVIYCSELSRVNLVPKLMCHKFIL